MRAVRVTAVLAAILLTATTAACDGADDPGDDPTTGSSETGATAPAGIPDVVAGRLTRILGNGGTEALRDTAYLPDTRLSEPVLVAAGPDGELIGLQRRQPGLFTVSPDGTVQPVSGDRSVAGSAAIAALAGDENLLLLLRGENATLGRVDVADGAYTEVATLPGPVAEADAGAILDLPGGLVVQWGSSWWTVAGTPDDAGTAAPMAAPVEGSIVAARTASGVAVLTATELVLLDDSLQETGRYPWTRPDEAAGTITSASGDGGDGLVVTATERGESGAVVHVTPDGAASVLADGFKPDDTTPSTDCDNADTEALRSHLAQPLSVVVWQDRIVVADQRCNSVLQLAPPAVS